MRSMSRSRSNNTDYPKLKKFQSTGFLNDRSNDSTPLAFSSNKYVKSYENALFHSNNNLNGLKNGKKLIIRGKDLQYLDEDIFQLKSSSRLTCLELSPDRQACLNYKLDKLPSNINLFINLRELQLDTNNLSELPQQIGELKSLERLGLSNNSLKTLPDDTFSKLLNLKSLHLANNKFESIPSCIYGLKSLEFLDLTSNMIRKLDKNILKLKNTIRVLIFYDNKINEIGSWIDGLTLLEVIWLGSNRLKQLPMNIINIKNLDWKSKYLPLILDNNPLNEPPLVVCKCGFEAMKIWYDEHNKNMESRKNGQNATNSNNTNSQNDENFNIQTQPIIKRSQKSNALTIKTQN